MNNKRPHPRATPLDYALAVLAALAGCALAIVHLVFKPVETVSAPAHAHAHAQAGDSSRVVFIPGSRDAAKGASWVRKRQQILVAAPGEIALSEDELNAWFSASTHVKHARKSARAAGELIEISQPDFRISGGFLQVAAPATLRVLGAETPLIVQMRGDFSRTEANPETGLPSVVMYSPKEFFAGSLPLHRLPGATSFVMNSLLANQALPGEAVAAWQKITRVAIFAGELRITISP